jgi:hypothetical protein
MSEERTRFPIQPDDRRRTGRSSENIKTVPDELPEAEEEQQDKPPVPPHRRGERSGESDEGDDDTD